MSMIKVKFYECNNKNIKNEKLKFAVIIARHKSKWVFCKHNERNTYECPGGHREANEDIISTAERELYEETGAIEYCLEPICIYSVLETKIKNNKEMTRNSNNNDLVETFGMLFFADIKTFGNLPQMEIERVELFNELPNNWTYPLIQPYLFRKLQEVKQIL